MIRLPPFEYLTPQTIDEAVTMLAENPTAALVAGGTDLFANMKRGQVMPVTVVGLGGVAGLRGIAAAADGSVSIGSLTPLRELAESADVPAALATAAGEVASPQIRNMATVGGNLCADTRCGYINVSEAWRQASGLCLKAEGDVCWVAPQGEKCVAVSSSDLAPVVVALDADIGIVGPDGTRSLPAADLFRPDGIDYLGKSGDEVLTTITLPDRRGWRTSYRKLRRRGSVDFPILGVAAAVQVSTGGVVEDARLVLGAVAPTPIRTRAAEEAVVGTRLDDDAITRAADLAAKQVRPYDNVDLGSRYRKWMAPVFVTRALEELR